MTASANQTAEKARDSAIVLQDHKRLPARFFARIAGARTCRLG